MTLFRNGIKILAILFALVAIFGISAGATTTTTTTKKVRISLVLLCDVYAMGEKNGRGGFARAASVIKAERARNKHVIVAHAGDAISPSLFSGIDQGAHIIDLTNMLAPDVFVPGNHEYDFGESVYRKRMAEASFSILAANLRDAKGQKLPGHADVKWFEFEGLRLAVIGLTADNSPAKSQPGTLKFAPSVPTGKSQAARLRAQGADIVVAVAHAGRRQDLRLFYSGALDVLLSGDDHDLALLYDGRTAMVEAKQEAEYITVIDLEVTIKTKGGSKIPSVATAGKTVATGKSGVAIKKASRKVRWWPRFRIIDTADVTPDPLVAAKVASYQKLVAKELDVALGKTARELDSRKATVRLAEAAIGNLITDAMRLRFNADVAIMNGGGIRGDRIYAAGSDLTRRHILTEMPFGNKLLLLELTGAELMQVLENGLKFAGKPHGRFPQISGATISAKTSKLPGQRITLIDIGNEPLDPKQLYKVAVNDFMAAGKEGYGILKTAKRIIGPVSAPLITNVVMSYIRKQGTVSVRKEGRLTLYK